MDKIKLFNYGRNYSSSNPNTIGVDFGPLELYFSYTTIVAFRTPNGVLVISENVWSTTTGKHLNMIDPDKKKRIPYSLFETQLELLMNQLTISLAPQHEMS